MSLGWYRRRSVQRIGAPSLIARRRLLSAIAALPVVALLPACGGPDMARENENDRERLQQYREELQRYAELGYHSRYKYETESVTDFWFSPSDEVAVSLTLPRVSGRFPLIVYLPGLGESANDGLLWRQSWAEAGYAVLALQPLAVAQAWSSQQARNGEFADIVRDQFASAALASRATAVRFGLDEAGRLATQGTAPYGRIDFSNIVIAGYDLGAQTLQYLAGEHVPGMNPVPAMPVLRATIALSPYVAPPYVGVEPAVLAARYGDMHLPMLGITGDEDVDGYEMVTIASARHAPFRYMASGDKYLMTLNGGSHRLLSGLPLPELANNPQSGSPPSYGGGMDGGRRGPGGGSGPGGGPGGGGASGGGPGGGGPGGNPEGPDGGRSESGGRRPRIDLAKQIAAQERQIIAIRQLSIAFLDTVVKQDTNARDWLVRDARPWLQPIGSLMGK